MLGQSIGILNQIWARQGGNLPAFNLPLYCSTLFYLRSFVSCICFSDLYVLLKKKKNRKNNIKIKKWARVPKKIKIKIIN